MEEKAKKLLAAIKKDDLTAFKKEFNKDTEKYSFGRFPLLSLCYLYGSVKIALTYEKKLLSVSRYTIVEEDRESYYLFRKRAHRVLRLFVGARRPVSPLVMLALLGRHDSLKTLYPIAYKDETIREEIAYAAETIFGSVVEFGKNRIRIRRQHTPRLQKITTYVACALSIVIVACALLGYFLMPNDKGTEDSPVTISSEKQLVLALQNEGYYKLADDVTLTVNPGTAFKGSLNGNGHKVALSASSAGTVFSQTEGTIKDVEFVIDAGEVETSESLALLIAENTGTLENVKLTVKGKISVKEKENAGEEQEQETVYISAFVGQNSGIVSGCAITCDLTADNPGGRNAYLSVLVSENSGTVTKCSTSGKVASTTTDLAGLVAENKEGGVISGCESNASLSQETSQKGWSPNVAGVCLHNYGTVSDCLSKGSVTATCELESTDSTEEQSEVVYLGGISCINEGTIENCRFDGEIAGKSQGALFYVGGVVSLNTGTIVGCVSSGSLKTEAKESRSFVGGIAGINYYGLENNTYRFGSVENAVVSVRIECLSEDTNDVNAGGIVGFNNGGKVTGGETSANIECDAQRFFLGGAVGCNTSPTSLYYYSPYLGVFGVTSTASITSLGEAEQDNYVGGIAGATTVNVSGCEFNGKLKGKNGLTVGGIAGLGRYSIEGCTATSTIEAGNKGYAGGIVGTGDGRVINCASTLTATVRDECFLGGIVGSSSYQNNLSTTISGCSATVTIEAGEKTTAGGIVGKSSAVVSECEAEGTLSGDAESAIGGLIGYNAGGIVKISKTSVKTTAGSSSVLGGIVGKNEQGKVGHCFSSCEFAAGDGSFVGGVVGSADGYSVKYTYTYKEANREKAKQYCIMMYGDDSNLESVLEESFSNNAYYYKNNYVGTDKKGFGKINDYDDAPEEVYDLQTTAYSTEEEMEKSDAYKEVFESEAK